MRKKASLLGILFVFAAVCLVKKRKEPIPFIPFLLLGMEVLLFYG